MRSLVDKRKKALVFRKKGYSVKEIAATLNVAQSTSSLWVRNAKLDTKAQERLKERRLLGYYRAGLSWERKRRLREQQAFVRAKAELQTMDLMQTSAKLCCALLYWCEGAKGDKDTVRFVNSDPVLIQLFLTLLRSSFIAKEKKFRATLHLHSYHNENKQKEFWSRVTHIPQSQFHKTYRKQNTKKRTRDGYPGCIDIAYYDIAVAREIRALFQEFAKRMCK